MAFFILRISIPEFDICRTVKFEQTLTIDEGIKQLFKRNPVDNQDVYRLYLPAQQMWLDAERTFSEYGPLLQHKSIYLELKRFGEETNDNRSNNNNNNNNNNILLHSTSDIDTIQDNNNNTNSDNNNNSVIINEPEEESIITSRSPQTSVGEIVIETTNTNTPEGVDTNIWDEPPDNPNNIKFGTDYSGKTIILAATFNKLVERLTSEKEHDLMFMKVFILTYQSFTTPDKFFDKLMQRYRIPLSIRLSSQSISDAKSIHVPIQLRVCNVMKNWIELCFSSDFDDALLSKLNQFTEELLAEESTQSLGKKLKDTIAKQTIVAKEPKKIFTEEPPLSKIPRNLHSANLNFMDIDDEEIARQFTCIDYDMFAKIKPTELLNQAWNKQELRHRSPNVLKLIQRFNMVSSWIGSMIVKVDNVKSRAKMFEKCINICKHLQKLNNFSSMMAFIAGLNCSAVARLSLTKKELLPKALEDLVQLENLMSAEGSFKVYRNTIHHANPPLIPYMGVYLQDLTFIEDGNPDYIGHLINFEKRRLVCNSIQEMMTYQQQPYNINQIPKIITLFKKLPSLPDRELYQLSLRHEPRRNTNS